MKKIENAKEMKIEVINVTREKKNKKGNPFISVQDERKVWWYVDEPKLFHLFEKGVKLNVICTEENAFMKILDVISDEIGVRPQVPETKKTYENNNFQIQVLESLRIIEQKIDNLKVERGDNKLPF